MQRDPSINRAPRSLARGKILRGALVVAALGAIGVTVGAVAARGLIRATARRRGEVVTMGQMLAEQGVQAQAPPMTEEFQRWLESSDISVAEIRNAAA